MALLAFAFCFVLFFVLCNKIPPALEECYGIRERSEVCCHGEEKSHSDGGREGERSRGRDMQVAEWWKQSERRGSLLSPVSTGVLRGLAAPLGGGSITEHGDLSIILTSLIPQRELAMTTNLYTCCLFLIFSLHVSCRTLSTHLFVFQNFSLLKLKSHLYNLLSTLWSWYLKRVIVYQHSLQVYIVSYCLCIGLCQI